MPADSWAEADTLPHESKNPLIKHIPVEICLQIQINPEGFSGLFFLKFHEYYAGRGKQL